ncbi:hypothetical protein [Longimicrobium sp.]|uniref:hypothetical protein n=1 Tax=Longimicrobium sp. TaxID=2029185 RepID=UPI002E317EF6|nr:hypothetical protein [Longimicrobium sp.]HEX6041140.1 hypothetical protein [Longimicrobium sp.]
MKKLALNIEELSVESFDTGNETPVRGTVAANVTTGNQIICECTYDVGSCDYTCADTCSNSCGGGCGGGTGFCTNDNTCATGRQIICEC